MNFPLRPERILKDIEVAISALETEDLDTDNNVSSVATRAEKSNKSQNLNPRNSNNCLPRYPRSRTYDSALIPNLEDLMRQEFIAMDFETANKLGGVSACQIALVKICDGEITNQFTSYILPPSGYQHFEFTWLHGISFADVAAAPTWAELAEEIKKFIGELPVYAHNAKFDARVWRELDRYFGVKSYPKEFYCTYRMAARAIPDLANHKLPTVTAYFAPEYQLNHHEAFSDAKACAQIVIGLQRLLCGNQQVKQAEN